MLWLTNRLLQKFGYILLEKAVLDQVMRLSIAYLHALQKQLKENEVVVYEEQGDSGTANVVTLH